MNQETGSPAFSDSQKPEEGQKKPEQQKWRFQANTKYFTICVYVIATFCICLFLYKFTNNWSATTEKIGDIFGMLTPFLLAFLIAYFINPLIHMVYRFSNRLFKDRLPKVHKILSLILAYVIFIGVIVLLLIFILPQVAKSIMDLVLQIPVFYANINNALENLGDIFPGLDVDAVQEFLDENIPTLVEYAKDFAADLIPVVYNAVGSAVSLIINIILAFVISCYIMSDKNNLVRGLKRIIYALFPEKHAKTVIAIIKKSSDIFSAYIVGKAIDSLIIGILCFIVMNIIGLPYRVLVSVIVGVTNMIPYFGPFIGAIPGAILMLLSGPMDCVIFLIMILALQQFDGNILGPKILGDSTGLKPIWIIFAITVGGYVAGVIGMFLGVPVTAVIAYLLNTFVDYVLRRRELSPELADSLRQTEGAQEGPRSTIIGRLTNPPKAQTENRSAFDPQKDTRHSVNAAAKTPARQTQGAADPQDIPADARSSTGADISSDDSTETDG